MVIILISIKFLKSSSSSKNIFDLILIDMSAYPIVFFQFLCIFSLEFEIFILYSYHGMNFRVFTDQTKSSHLNSLNESTFFSF